MSICICQNLTIVYLRFYFIVYKLCLKIKNYMNYWTLMICSLQSKGLSRVFSNTTVQKPQFFGTQLSSQSNTHIHTWPLEKTIALTRRTFVGKVMSLLFNMLSRLVITFLPRSKCLNFMAAITICSDFGAHKNKVWHCFHCFPIISHEVMGPDAMIFIC